MATVAERVNEVTARVLKVPQEQIRPEQSFAEDLGAESVQSIELVAMFEEEFGIEIPDDAAETIQTFGDAVKFIKDAS